MDTGLGCHLLRLLGSKIPNGGMDPLPIVVAFNIGEQIAPRFVECVPVSLPDEFDLERMKEALHWRIIVAAARPAHGRDARRERPIDFHRRQQRIEIRDPNDG